MKDYYFVATLTAQLTLNDEEFNLLFTEAERHYDFTIKSITKVGGFLYGLQNRRLFATEAGKPDNDTSFSESQLNLLMKALEMNHSENALKLSKKLFSIFIDLQRQTVEVNKLLNDIGLKGHFTDP